MIAEAKNKYGNQDSSLGETTISIGNSDVICSVYFKKSNGYDLCYIAADWLNDTVWLNVTVKGDVVFRTIDNKDAVSRNSVTPPYAKTRVVQVVNGQEYKANERYAYKFQLTLDKEEKSDLMKQLKEMTSGKGDLFNNLKKTIEVIDQAQ